MVLPAILLPRDSLSIALRESQARQSLVSTSEIQRLNGESKWDGGGSSTPTAPIPSAQQIAQTQRAETQRQIDQERQSRISEARSRFQESARTGFGIAGRESRLKELRESISKANIQAEARKVEEGIIKSYALSGGRPGTQMEISGDIAEPYRKLLEGKQVTEEEGKRLISMGLAKSGEPTPEERGYQTISELRGYDDSKYDTSKGDVPSYLKNFETRVPGPKYSPVYKQTTTKRGVIQGITEAIKNIGKEIGRVGYAVQKPKFQTTAQVRSYIPPEIQRRIPAETLERVPVTTFQEEIPVSQRVTIGGEAVAPTEPIPSRPIYRVITTPIEVVGEGAREVESGALALLKRAGVKEVPLYVPKLPRVPVPFFKPKGILPPIPSLPKIPPKDTYTSSFILGDTSKVKVKENPFFEKKASLTPETVGKIAGLIAGVSLFSAIPSGIIWAGVAAEGSHQALTGETLPKRLWGITKAGAATYLGARVATKYLRTPIKTTKELRPRLTDTAQEETKIVDFFGKPKRVSKYKIISEIRAPTRVIETTRGREILRLKPKKIIDLPPRYATQVTADPITGKWIYRRGKFTVIEARQGSRYGTLFEIKGTPTEIFSKKIARLYPKTKEVNFFPPGRRIRRQVFESQQKPFVETDLFKITKIRTKFKDITLPPKSGKFRASRNPPKLITYLKERKGVEKISFPFEPKPSGIKPSPILVTGQKQIQILRMIPPRPMQIRARTISIPKIKDTTRSMITTSKLGLITGQIAKTKDKLDIAIKPQLKVRQKEIQKFLIKPVLRQTARTNQLIKPSELLKTTPKEKISSSFKSALMPKQRIKQKTKQRIKEELIFAKSPRPAPPMLRPTPVEPTPKIPGFIPKLPEVFKKRREQKLTSKKGLFIPEVRRGGKFMPISGPVSFSKALGFGKRKVKETLGASLRIRKKTGEIIPLSPSLGFRPSKQDPFTLVQRRETRLKSPKEIKEILGVRRKLRW